MHTVPRLFLQLMFMVATVGCGQQAAAPATLPSQPAKSDQTQAYIGSSACAECHAAEYEFWQGSHHQLAMQPASKRSVAGDFDDSTFSYAGVASRFTKTDSGYVVHTEGADGELLDFLVRYTFGVAPLQQYLLQAPNGRLQALDIAWDARTVDLGGQRWFHLHGDEYIDHTDVLHWTQPSANWNFICADCHSTALQKNYNPETRTYETQFAEVSVGCEACHGAGGLHVTWARGDLERQHIEPLTSQQSQINACAPCHSRRSQLAEGFAPGKHWLDYYLPALLDEDLYHPDGQIQDEVYVYGSFTQSRMHQQGVMCSHCHEPHSAQLKIAGNGVCTQCHNATGRSDFPTLPKANFDSVAHHFHQPDSAGSRCVSCHMPAKTYMVVDDRRDHSFRIPRPDLSASLGVPNACTGCHVDQSDQWADEAIEVWYPGERDAHFAPVLAAARRADSAAEVALVELASDIEQPVIVRATALSLMSGYGLRVSSKASSNALEQGLRDTHPLVRIGALRGARRWPPEQHWRATNRLLDDKLAAVRIEATRGLLSALPGLARSAQNAFRPYLQDYLQMLSFNADVAGGQSNMASVHLALGDIPAAEEALRTSLQLNPSWVPALVNLADLYRGTGRDTDGGELLDRALSLAPDAADVLLAKALWFVRQGDAEAGLPLLGRAWQFAPQNPRYAYVYVVALHSLGRPMQALQAADQTLALRWDEQLLQTALSIARDAGLDDKVRAYAEVLRDPQSQDPQ